MPYNIAGSSAQDEASLLADSSQQDQAMAKQYSGNYGQDAKHSLVGTILGMVPGWGQVAQSLMSDGTGPASQYITGGAAQQQSAGGGMGGSISSLIQQGGGSSQIGQAAQNSTPMANMISPSTQYNPTLMQAPTPSQSYAMGQNALQPNPYGYNA